MTCAGADGIKPHSYHAWTKEFMEAGKERVDPGRGAGRYAAGGTGAQERERRTQAVGGGAVPGGAPSEKTAIPMPHDAAGTNG